MTQYFTLASRDFFGLLYSDFSKSWWKGRSGVSGPQKSDGGWMEFSGSGDLLSMVSPSRPQGQSQAR